jgi:8-oxo-dGTP pyrophosphatase MutT (NUDIX family)
MGDIDISQKDPYFIAVKVFLERANEFLILKDKFGDWDLPGGQIKKFEFETPLPDIVKRKMIEEVGDSVLYKLAPLPEILMRHERIEASPGNPTVHIFGLGYRATLESGEVLLSDSHTELLWVDKATFVPEDYFTGGWLKGVQQYLNIPT